MSSGVSSSAHRLDASKRHLHVLQQQSDAKEPSPLLRLPAELRQQILTHLFAMQLYSTLEYWAAVAKYNAEPNRRFVGRRVRIRFGPQAQTESLLHTLRTLAITCTRLRNDMTAILLPLTADLLTRWHHSERQCHTGLYEHMETLVSDGLLNTRSEDGSTPLQISTMDQAVKCRAVAANAVYQDLAARVIYEHNTNVSTVAEEIGTTEGSILAFLAVEMQKILKVEWMLEVSASAFGSILTGMHCESANHPS